MPENGQVDVVSHVSLDHLSHSFIEEELDNTQVEIVTHINLDHLSYDFANDADDDESGWITLDPEEIRTNELNFDDDIVVSMCFDESEIE